MALWVQIDQENPFPGFREGCAQTDGVGGLAHPALLIDQVVDVHVRTVDLAQVIRLARVRRIARTRSIVSVTGSGQGPSGGRTR